MPVGDDLVGGAELVLALAGVRCVQRAEEVRTENFRHGEAGEGATQPLRVRDVAAFHDETEPHQVPDETPNDDR
jgi:hypothetical protein